MTTEKEPQAGVWDEILEKARKGREVDERNSLLRGRLLEQAARNFQPPKLNRETPNKQLASNT